jgi:NAD(P)H-nitrite reductase large subunit
LLFLDRRRNLSRLKRATKPEADPSRRRRRVGIGAAGFAAAEMLRREKYEGEIVMLSGDDAPPVDRPNLSKDYLAGNAPEEWVPLRPVSFYTEHGIDLRLNTNVVAIDPRARKLALADGSDIPFDRLLLATAPSRRTYRPRALTRSNCACSVRSPTAALSSRKQRIHAKPSYWGQVLSGSRLRPLSAGEALKSMSLRRKGGLWSGFLAPN